ncbi:hypothetical protein AGOR_G00240440 [Albula goreensis]|uniref:Uncharacterized protein n=1 Tax=Albula goreensis TaxID=1534307 RepID=A0A8T3CG99_9TELE|nr:hypothetical protein AGOR_G00240440 [Albula goreensis]
MESALSPPAMFTGPALRALGTCFLGPVFVCCQPEHTATPLRRTDGKTRSGGGEGREVSLCVCAVEKRRGRAWNCREESWRRRGYGGARVGNAREDQQERGLSPIIPQQAALGRLLSLASALIPLMALQSQLVRHASQCWGPHYRLTSAFPCHP